MELLLEPYNIIKFLHIIMAGLWLGMDMGVYTAGMRVRDPSLSIETRSAMGKISGFLDMGPRSAVVILLTLGITMTSIGGYGFVGEYATDLALSAAIVGLVWLAGIWHQYWVDHPNLGEERPEAHVTFQKYFRNIDLCMRAIITGALAVTAIWSLLGDGPILATWLSVKMIIFALIISCGVGIRVYIPQTRHAIAEIFKNGSSPEREAALGLNKFRLLLFVKCIWALVALVIWISVTKF